MPAPFLKTSTTVDNTGVPIDDLDIADVIKPGQRKFLVARNPSNALPWAGYWNALLTARDSNYRLVLNADQTLNVDAFDKFDSVRCVYLTTQFDDLPTVGRVTYEAPWGLDTVQAQAAKDSLVKLILAKKVKIEPFEFADTVHVNDGTSEQIVSIRRPWEETNEVRRGIIAPYIHTITGGRQVYDFGDDDFNGTITYDPDPEKSEKLINNVDYYYAIRGYDEGDYLIGTAPKLNLKAVGLSNTVTVTPLASRPGGTASVEFRVDPDQQARLGGIYNIRLLIQDQQRFNQLFAGKTLELEFYRQWFGVDHNRNPADDDIGMYGLSFHLRDSATGASIGQWSTALPPELCGGSGVGGYFTENTVTWVDTTGIGELVDSSGVIYDTVYDATTGQIIRIDTTTFQLATSTEKVIRSGSFTTDATCFFGKYALGTVGVAFDYAIQQWGGVYRTLPDGEILSGGDPNILVCGGRNAARLYNETSTLNQPPADFESPYPGFQLATPWATSYNNGPGVYEIEFLEGGTETITTSFRTSPDVGDPDNEGKEATFPDVPYMNLRIRNVAQFDRTDVKPDGTVSTATVSYPFDLSPTTVPLTDQSQYRHFPTPELVPIGTYGLAAYGWRNSQMDWGRTLNIQNLAAESNSAKPVGTQGRYYRSRNLSTDGRDTLDFTHVLMIGGCEFAIDFSRFGGRNSVRNTFGCVHGNADYQGKPGVQSLALPKTDFKPGDKIRVQTFGGALGYPFDGTKAYAKIGQYDPEVANRPYTEEELEQIQVVPNPYYVTHEGMRSPYEGRLYFTRLPRKATIKIYTTAGELVNTYQHDETTSESPSSFGTYVWDLLTKNRQRVASQMLIAKIETPDGASVTRKFTIVVGPARIITE